jgi:hypothetical protein
MILIDALYQFKWMNIVVFIGKKMLFQFDRSNKKSFHLNY